jgi:hypothetical protein
MSYWKQIYILLKWGHQIKLRILYLRCNMSRCDTKKQLTAVLEIALYQSLWDACIVQK